jgi:hypothetical protein
MPAKTKSKIIAVSLDNTTLNFDDTEGVEPDFDKVMEDVKLDDVQPDEIKSDDVKIEIPIKEKKPRAKAKPKAKQVVEQVVEPIEEPLLENVSLNTNKKQVAELVECPDCKKKLSAKTYKYNHVHNCPAKRFTPPTTEPVIEQPPEADIIQPTEPEIQPYDFEPVLKQPSVRELRAQKRRMMIDSLMKDAF